MKFKIGLLCVASMLLHVVFAGTDLKVGIVDLQKIVAEAPEVNQINKGLSKQFETRKQQLIAKRKALQDRINKFQRENAVMTEVKRQAESNALAQERRNLLRLEQDFGDDLELARAHAMKDLLKKVKKQIDVLAKKEHYDLILQRGNVPYYRGALDITNKILHKI